MRRIMVLRLVESERLCGGDGNGFLEHIYVRIRNMNVKSFTDGLLKPEIVIPKLIWEGYSHDELKSVVWPKRTHIRLGHL